MLNSVIISLVATFFVVFLGSLSAFVFVRTEFFGKNFLFQLVILLMLIPSIITLTPLYLLCVELGIDNTWFALWLPSVAGGQVSAIFLFSTFFRQQPKDIFDAARIDGAGAARMYLSLCLPLAVPVLCIQAVNTFAMCYNDFMWPSIIISETAKHPLMPRAQESGERRFPEQPGGRVVCDVSDERDPVGVHYPDRAEILYRRRVRLGHEAVRRGGK